MSFSYEPQGWQAPAPARQPSWEQISDASRSSPATPDGNAFAMQFEGRLCTKYQEAYTDLSCEEVDRALDNLVKSGKVFPGGPRREPMPMMAMGRPYPDYGWSTFSSLESVVLSNMVRASHAWWSSFSERF